MTSGLTKTLEPNIPHVFMISGGLDSVTLAHHCRAQSTHIKSMLFFDYGHEAAGRELRAARRASVATDYSIEMVDVANLKYLYHGLIAGEYHPMMAECKTNDYFIFQSIAASYALLRGIHRVIVGVIKEDTIVHPGLETFLDEFGSSLGRLHNLDFKFTVPFIDKEKSEIAKMACDAGIDISATYGCHTGSAIHCGVCNGCQKRQAAFTKAGLTDPTYYSAISGSPQPYPQVAPMGG